MSRIFAIAGLFIRKALRARSFFILMVSLLLVLIMFPLIVRGDGSAVGGIKMLVSYSLATCAIILAITTLWSCCGAISQEISDRSLQLVAVKPVRAVHVWIGKWLGAVTINVVLLAMIGVALFVLVAWCTRPSVMASDDMLDVGREVLSARIPVSPPVRDVEQEARATAEMQARTGQIHPGLKEAAYRHNLNQLRYAQFTVAPGETRRWMVNVPRHVSSGDSVFRFRLVSSYRTRNPVYGFWRIGDGDRSVVFPVKDCINGPHAFLVPAGIVVPGEQLALSFSNDGSEQSHTAVFDYDGGIELRCWCCGFSVNLVRCLFVIGGLLAFIASLGITAGALLSFPVAVFCSVTLTMICLLSHAAICLGNDYEPAGYVRGVGKVMGAIEDGGEVLMSVIERSVGPVFAINPIGHLADGVHISWGTVANANLLIGVVYPLILAMVGSALMKRRELAA